MATYDTLTAIDNYLKEYYDNFDAVLAVYARKFKLLSMIDKVQNVTGNPMKIPIITGDGAGIGGDYTTANASATGISAQAFYVQTADIVGLVPLDYKSSVVAKPDKGAFIDYIQRNIDAKLNAIGRIHARHLFGNGGGSIGRRLSASTNVITLETATDTINFWPGQVIRASTGDGTSGAHTQKTGSTTVVSVNREGGTVTLASAAAISGFADNDYLFIDGLFAGDVSQTRVMKGLSAWFTTTAATDTLWTVNRTNFPELSGFRNPNAATAGGVVDRMRALATLGDVHYEANPTLGVVHSLQWEVAAKTLQNQGYRPIEVGETETQAGYKKLAIVGQYGEVSLIGDAFCPLLTGYLLDPETIQIAHNDEKLINFAESPQGTKYWQASATIGHELRIVSYPNFASNAPHKNGSTPLPALP